MASGGERWVAAAAAAAASAAAAARPLRGDWLGPGLQWDAERQMGSGYVWSQQT